MRYSNSKTIESDASYQQTATPCYRNYKGSLQTYLSAQILRRTSTPRNNLYGKYGLSFLLFHNWCAYRAGCGANAYCEVGFDKTTGEERPVCLCNPGYVGKERLNRVVTKLKVRSFISFKHFFYIVFALGGSPTPHPISSQPHFVCKFIRQGSSSPVTCHQSPGPKYYGIGIP